MRSYWSPQLGPQTDLLAATWCRFIFFGGARGGGKTDGGLGDYLQDVERYHKHWQGIVFRESYPELQGIIQRSHAILASSGAEWKEAKHQWNFSNGATLKFRHIENDYAAGQYQGHQYPWMLFEELAKWPSPKAFDELKACNRWAEIEIPTKRIRATGNPGGPGHQWIQQRYIDPAPLGNEPFQDPKTGWWNMYIPSRVTDNIILLLNDPGYIDSLKGVGSDELVRAWLLGDWSAITGAYFDCFSIPKHVCAPFEIPDHWLRFRCFDWGSYRPYCCLWIAVASEDMFTEGKRIAKGSLVVYKELYGASSPNVGLKEDVATVAAKIRHMDGDDDITYSVADPSMWKQDGGPSLAEEFNRRGVNFRPADNSRLAGANQVRARLLGEGETPMANIFSTVKNLIRTLPALQHDPLKPEDVDTDGEDHPYDTFRYGAMSRPYSRPMLPAKPTEIKGYNSQTLDTLWAKTKTATTRW